MEEKVYVLAQQQGKYYVGQTGNLLRRIQEHLSGSGSKWTSIYSIIDIKEVRPKASIHDENNVTLEYMAKYGIDNVRGGSHVTEHLSDSEKTLIQREIWGMQGACSKCGRKTHYIGVCTQLEDINGKRLDEVRE